jgi:ABC-2 type transport system ATP-binding protein
MSAQNDLILQTKNLRKTYITKKGKETVEAVKGIDLSVSKGQIFGFLGPNGAGKTTTLQMLTTLLAPTSGEAMVVGFDLLKNPENIREYIGYVSQAGGSDTSTNAIENLMLQAQLYGASKATAGIRAKALIEQFEISEFATRKVTSYSGGQKRRLDLALGVVHKPQLIFLDEPTTGLDPQSRAHFWTEIRKIRDDGVTIFVTTHYLEEADNLCDYLAIVDHGAIVAEGTPEHLKRQIGGDSIIIGIENDKNLEKGKELLAKQKFANKIYANENKLHVVVKDGEKLLADVLRFLDSNRVAFQTIELSKPSLDDVFLQKTGRSLREGDKS